MGPRRRQSWLQRLGGVVGPERVGAVFIVFSVWAEGRHHADSVQADAAETHQVDVARIIRLERWRDSTAVRMAYLERRERERRLRHGRRLRDESPPFGPGFTPQERGTLLASVGKAFHGLFFFLGPND